MALRQIETNNNKTKVKPSRSSSLVYISPIAKRRDRMKELYQKYGNEILEFSSGDINFLTSRMAIDAACEAEEDPKFSRYPPTVGDNNLIDRLTEKIRVENKIKAKRDLVHITVGGMQAIFACFGALVDPGNRTIVPTPYWSPVKDMNSIFKGITDFLYLDKNDFSLDLERLESLVQEEKTKIIYVNTPHNPTGVTFDQKTLEGIGDIVLRKNLFVISDEAYESILFDDATHMSIGSIPGMHKRTASVYTFSKKYNMTGDRIGYITCGNEDIFEAIKKICLNSTNGVNYVAQRKALAALNDSITPRQQVQEYQKRRDTLVSGLADLSLKVIVPRGTYYCFVDVSPIKVGHKKGRSIGECVDEFLFNECKVSTCPGIYFGKGWGSYLRFGFSIENESRIKEAVERIKKVI